MFSCFLCFENEGKMVDNRVLALVFVKIFFKYKKKERWFNFNLFKKYKKKERILV